MFTLIREMLAGKDLYRTLMNMECRPIVLEGEVLDLGSGVGRASYHRFFENRDARVIALDGQHDNIDFEKDSLPYEKESFDSVLAFNLLEHVYHYNFLLSEIRRVLTPGGRVIGAVPFLVGYHADPRDFFRYTSDALRIIFQEAGFENIEIITLGRGPLSVAYSQIEFLIPRIIKIIFLPSILFLDRLVLPLISKINREKFALGLFFSLSK
jgi:SAM-dependent methyltransferase